jgi:hypothetical protein
MIRRSVLFLALAFLAAVPATASAAGTYRYVVPDGATSGACGDTACEIHHALTQADPSDTVFVFPGTYDIGTGLAVPAGVTMRGAPGASPFLLGSSSGALVTAADGATLRFLRIRQDSGSRVIDSTVDSHSAGVTLDNLFVERAGSGSSGAPLVTLGDKDQLRGSVVWARPGTEPSIGVQLGSPSGMSAPTPVAILRNDTIWTPDAGSVGVAAVGSCSVEDCSSGTSPILNVGNVITRGGGLDLFAFGKSSTGTQKATLSVEHSNYRASSVSSPGGTITDGGGNQTADDPRLEDPSGGDFHARPESHVVDAGLVDAFTGSRDLDGYPLPTPGTPPDIGAYERPLPLTGSTGPATGVGATHATFAATFDSHNRPARAYFQFGGSGYGQRTPNAKFAAADGSRSLSSAVGELEPDHTYHFRLVVISEGDVVYGADQKLRTAKACVVPDLARLSLSRAKRGLSRARCRLGHVSRPSRVQRGYTLVVGAERPGADSTRPVNTRVNLKLVARRR